MQRNAAALETDSSLVEMEELSAPPAGPAPARDSSLRLAWPGQIFRTSDELEFEVSSAFKVCFSVNLARSHLASAMRLLPGPVGPGRARVAVTIVHSESVTVPAPGPGRVARSVAVTNGLLGSVHMSGRTDLAGPGRCQRPTSLSSRPGPTVTSRILRLT